jgi:hypothetical protein
MKYGIPCHVEKVTKQARMVYDIKGDLICFLHCFADHIAVEVGFKDARETWHGQIFFIFSILSLQN